jgi:oxygen-dependent protoporphyrinogen oxidase
MIGGQRNRELALEEERLIKIARQGVRDTMGVDEVPSVTFVQRWPKGIPNYRVGHLANVNRIFTQLKEHPGLYLTSNAYYGIGVNDCVAASLECARRVAGD